jgi:hypothetical protein|tara:strand:+ start:130 stop:384 length:255 start_codon:yes stop_codon:yes gene_type:complete
MNRYTIQTPIWDGGYQERAIGIAPYRIPCVVNINYKDKDNNLIYPDEYIITKDFANQFEIKVFKNNLKLIVIPVSKLKKYKGED